MEYAANENIDALLVKFLAGETTPDEATEVLAWVERSEDNSRYFHQFSLIWSESNLQHYNAAPDEDVAWKKFLPLVQSHRSQTPVIRIRWLRMVAAVVFVALGSILFYVLTTQRPQIPQQLLSQATNKVLIDTLTDGSIITLNKKASLSYPSTFNGDKRKVTLTGEAFFNIAADKTKPFVIDVADVQVKVVGTSFNIKNDDSGTAIIVTSGIVQVTHAGKILELRKGEQTLVTRTDTILSKSTTTDQLFNYYVSHTFVCDNTPLWKLRDKLNEAYGVNIIIAKQQLRSMPLTVTFHEESLDTILKILEQTLLIKVTRTGNDILLQ